MLHLCRCFFLTMLIDTSPERMTAPLNVCFFDIGSKSWNNYHKLIHYFFFFSHWYMSATVGNNWAGKGKYSSFLLGTPTCSHVIMPTQNELGPKFHDHLRNIYIFQRLNSLASQTSRSRDRMQRVLCIILTRMIWGGGVSFRKLKR